MPGFFIEIENSSKIKNFNSIDQLLESTVEEDDFFVHQRTINKFNNDKLFINNNNYFYILDGVILNKKSLENKYSSEWEDVFIQMYKKNGDNFFKDFRGSFAGALFDKKNKKWIIFTDHIGSKHIYFSTNELNMIFSTDISLIYNYLKQNDITFSIDYDAVYMLLSYGFMLEDYTLCSKIKKLLPGHYLVYKDGKHEIKQFYKISNQPDYSKTEDEFIELMDDYFRKAVKLQFDKDKEYEYNHFVGLSGGLDSRMTSCVAHELGYTEQINFTFSQTNYLDETIAKQIAHDFKHEWIFKALDGGDFLKNFEEITKITGANATYFGLAHQNSLYKLINFKNLGIIHTGQLGDVVFGTFYSSLNPQLSFKIADGANSKTFLNKIKNLELQMLYENQEIFNFYNRGFSGANNGLLMPQQYSETISPFYDVELLNFALSIPLEFRYQHKIYKKWILKKYLKVAKYIWESEKIALDSPTIKIMKKDYYIEKIPSLILNKTRRFFKISNNKSKNKISKNNMNPLEYWLNTNIQLKTYLDDFFTTSIELIDNQTLKEDINFLYHHGTEMEQIQVITLLSFFDVFFNNRKEDTKI